MYDCQHSWFIECRSDETGKQVRTCRKCAARVWVDDSGVAEETVQIPQIRGSINNCLFNLSQLDAAEPPKEIPDGQAFL